jgi:hypothetical protein
MDDLLCSCNSDKEVYVIVMNKYSNSDKQVLNKHSNNNDK